MRQCLKCGVKKPESQFYQNIGGKRPGLLASRCKACELDRQAAYYQRHKERKKIHFAARYIALKDSVFAAYGGYKCACCGETEPTFLTIDHIGDNGSYHRREMSKAGEDYRSATGYKTYCWIIRNGFPAGFQVLCANCNHGRFRNHGICPHKRSEGSTTIPKGSTARAGRKSGAPLKKRVKI